MSFLLYCIVFCPSSAWVLDTSSSICYYVNITTKLNYADSSSACKNMGAASLKITSSAQQTFINNLVAKYVYLAYTSLYRIMRQKIEIMHFEQGKF